MGSRVLWLTEQREKRDENDEDIEDDEAAIPVSIQQLGLGLGFWKRGEGACLSVYFKSSVAVYLWRGSLFSTNFGFFMFFFSLKI